MSINKLALQYFALVWFIVWVKGGKVSQMFTNVWQYVL